MNRTEIKNELENRKKKLEEHLEKFNQLKAEGNMQAAFEQLKITLSYANETLHVSNVILKTLTESKEHVDISRDEECGTIAQTMSPSESEDCYEEESIKKIIVIPKNPNIH